MNKQYFVIDSNDKVNCKQLDGSLSYYYYKNFNIEQNWIFI